MGGKPRTVRISKDENAFFFPEHIRVQATRLFAALEAKSHFANLPAEEFATASAHFLAELNAVHAFREGNGRTQLTFFALLADRAGHPLAFEKLDPETMLESMISSFGGNESQLARVIADLIA